MTEVLQQNTQKTYVLPEALFFDPEMPDRPLDPERARANGARYLVAGAFSEGLRRKGVLLDIARTKTKPEDFVKSVMILWGEGPQKRKQEIDEIDIMYKAYRLGVFDEIFTEETGAEEVDEELDSEEEDGFDPEDDELILLEMELQTTPDDGVLDAGAL